MGNKLYVGGLPYSVTEGRLQEIFAAHGTVESAKLIVDKFTGQSGGFGFVEMGSGGEAQRAIQALNGTQLEGRSLVVNEAKPKGVMVAEEIEEREAAGVTAGNLQVLE
jgi:RNA recognition motif-containing protein